MGNKKQKTPKIKEPITLRTKALANGNRSLYLDIYRGNGNRDYEFLKLYLIPDTAPNAKEQNAEALKLANAVKAKKIVELQNSAHGFVSVSSRSKMNLLDYIQHIADKKLEKAGGNKRSTYGVYMALKSHLQQYAGKHTTFKQVDKRFCLGFIDYLKTAKSPRNGRALGENSQCSKMNMLAGVLNLAIAEEIINLNPFNQIKREDRPQKRPSEIGYLTPDDVKLLINTPYPIHPQTRDAFLFSCFTGLRFSDIKNLTWEQLKKDGTGATLLHFVQQKTKSREYLQINDEALKFLPDKGTAKGADLVFTLANCGYVNLQLKNWAILAEVKKHLTFHMARHTHATLMLSLGVPIETVSKVLGHSSIQTTQIYAKVMDKNKREAVDKLGSFLGGLTD